MLSTTCRGTQASVFTCSHLTAPEWSLQAQELEDVGPVTGRRVCISTVYYLCTHLIPHASALLLQISHLATSLSYCSCTDPSFCNTFASMQGGTDEDNLDNPPDDDDDHAHHAHGVHGTHCASCGQPYNRAVPDYSSSGETHIQRPMHAQQTNPVTHRHTHKHRKNTGTSAHTQTCTRTHTHSHRR